MHSVLIIPPPTSITTLTALCVCFFEACMKGPCVPAPLVSFFQKNLPLIEQTLKIICFITAQDFTERNVKAGKKNKTQKNSKLEWVIYILNKQLKILHKQLQHTQTPTSHPNTRATYSIKLKLNKTMIKRALDSYKQLQNYWHRFWQMCDLSYRGASKKSKRETRSLEIQSWEKSFLNLSSLTISSSIKGEGEGDDMLAQGHRITASIKLPGRQ